MHDGQAFEPFGVPDGYALTVPAQMGEGDFGDAMLAVRRICSILVLELLVEVFLRIRKARFNRNRPFLNAPIGTRPLALLARNQKLWISTTAKACISPTSPPELIHVQVVVPRDIQPRCNNAVGHMLALTIYRMTS